MNVDKMYRDIIDFLSKVNITATDSIEVSVVWVDVKEYFDGQVNTVSAPSLLIREKHK